MRRLDERVAALEADGGTGDAAKGAGHVIAFLTLCYSAIVWVIFFKLKLLPWNRGSQGAVVGLGIAAILALVIAMNLCQPFSQDGRRSIRISAAGTICAYSH